MKKKKQNHNEQRRRVSDFDTLNSQLGSFDLEPPRIYRDNAQRKKESPQGRKRNQVPSYEGRNAYSSPDRRRQNMQRQNRSRHDTPDEIRQRKKKNQKRRIIRIILVLITVAVIFTVLSLTVIFKINTITVSGNEKYSNDEILSVLPIEKEKNLFLADTKGAEEKLEQALPYIFDAQIQRKFPTTITVKITETPQVYCVKNQDKSYTLLDEKLKVLENGAANAPKKAITIEKLTLQSANPGQNAEMEKEQQQKDLLAITTAIRNLKLEKITAISSYQMNSNTVTYDARITIRLGTTENIEDKIYTALTSIEKLNETNPSAQGDLTVLDDKQVYFTEK